MSVEQIEILISAIASEIRQRSNLKGRVAENIAVSSIDLAKGMGFKIVEGPDFKQEDKKIPTNVVPAGTKYKNTMLITKRDVWQSEYEYLVLFHELYEFIIDSGVIYINGDPTQGTRNDEPIVKLKKLLYNNFVARVEF